MRTADPHVARGARALWAGPGARRALAAGGRGCVEFALHPGGYARFGDDAWLLLAVPRAPRGPLTLLVAGLDAAPLAAGDEVALAPPGRGVTRRDLAAPAAGATPPNHAAPITGATPPDHAAPAFIPPGLAAPTRERRLSQPLVVPFDGRVLRAGALRIDLSRLGSALALAVPPLSPGWRLALTAALEASPQPPRELVDGLAALRHGDRVAGVAALAGRGAGLTPAGDDALAGYAAWRHAQGEAVMFDGARCSPLGLAYLRCAERGELPEPVAAVLRAIRGGDGIAAGRRSRALSRWGASSGVAMLWGIAAAASS